MVSHTAIVVVMPNVWVGRCMPTFCLMLREDQLDGRNKVELGVLAGQIMAIKEGLGSAHVKHAAPSNNIKSCKSNPCV